MSARKETPEPQDAKPRRAVRSRNRLAPDAGNGKLSRPLAAAFILILAGGAYLFWPRGGGTPVGLGERLSVVTADTVTSHEPRSGTVDIEQEVTPLVAEAPASGPATAATGSSTPQTPPAQPPAPATRPAEPEPAPETPPSAPTRPATPPPAQTEPRPQARPPATPPPSAPSPAPERIQPGPTGGWAVQVGAYGAEQNAEKAALDLRADGIEAHVRAASTSTGELVYRVWIGWFSSRDQALAFARQERARLGDAHAVHR